MNILNFFKLKQPQQTTRPSYAYEWQIGQAQWSVVNDEDYIKETYNKLVWVYACVSKIAGAVSSVDWCLYKKTAQGLKELDTHPLLDMFNNKINESLTSRDFFDMWATYLSLQGKFFAQLDNPVLPQALYPLYPHLVKPVPSDDGRMVQSFEYDLKTIGTVLSPNIVLWDRFIDPLDFYQGFSPIRAMARTIDTENASVDWNKSTLDNACVPPGMIGASNPGKAAIEEIKRRWRKEYSGKNNARMPLIVDTERLSYIPFGLSAVDMDFMNQRKLSRIEICAGFEVPGQIVGDPEGQTYSNYAEALKSFWTNTVIPKYLEKIRKSLNLNIVSKWGSDLYIDFDLDGIEILKENQDAAAERVALLFEKNILKLNEARTSLGHEEDLENGELYNFQLAVASAKAMSEIELGEPDTEPDPDPDESTDGDEDDNMD